MVKTSNENFTHSLNILLNIKCISLKTPIMYFNKNVNRYHDAAYANIPHIRLYS